MKKLSLVAILLMVLFFVNNNAGAKGLNLEFANYQISPTENVDTDKTVEKTWMLNYSPDAGTIKIVKRNTKSMTHYTVKSKYFEVSYAAGPKGFGVESTRNKWETVPETLTEAAIDEDARGKQRVITPGKVDDETALKLIASFLPELLKDQYKNILFLDLI